MVTLMRMRKESSFPGLRRDDEKYKIEYYKDERKLPQGVLAKLETGRREMEEVLSQVEEADVSNLKPLLVGPLSDMSDAVNGSIVPRSNVIDVTIFKLPNNTVVMDEADGEIFRGTIVSDRYVKVEVREKNGHRNTRLINKAKADGEIAEVTTADSEHVDAQAEEGEGMSLIITDAMYTPDKLEVDIIYRTRYHTRPAQVDHYTCSRKTKGRITCNKSTTEGSWHQPADELQTD